MHLHHRRRSQHNQRPPPAPVRLILISRPLGNGIESSRLHSPTAEQVTATAQRLAAQLFCGFDRWAAAVHRPVPPATFPEAASQLRDLRWPRKALEFSVDFNQSNPYSLGSELQLNTSQLMHCELQDLVWLAHAKTAWDVTLTHKDHCRRRGFVCDSIFRRAHAEMLQRDEDRWGGLVPPQLVAMVRHTHHQHQQVYHAQPQPLQLPTTLSRQDTG